MKKTILGALLAAGVAAVWLSAGFGQSDSVPGLGLRLATPDRLRGVPLAFTPYSGDTLPAAVDLSPDMPPPGQQGSQNSCVGWAMAYALKSYQEKVEEKQPYGRDAALDARRVFSPAFIYNQCNGGRNVPILYADAFAILSEQGAATWADMPYNIADAASQPGAEIKQRAARYKIDFWRQVNAQDVKEVKAHLHAGFPVLIGANVDQAFIKHPAGTTWQSIGTVVGGHAMVVVGYDDARRAFRLMNSWGRDWADGGFCWVDYDLFRRVVNEAYVAKDARNSPAPAVVTPGEDPVPPPAPTPRRAASLALLAINHNASFPGRPDLGYFMKFDGSLDIPAGLGRSDQIVVYFYYDAGNGTPGAAVAGADRAYADINGWAACGTQSYPVPTEGLRTNWATWIPYAALLVPVGRNVASPQGWVYQMAETHLLAQAVLFVDGFGVVRSPYIPFFVRK
ncbi:MAG: C1 family peptidase [Candidatus Aminicenantes bacterium]|nr:C1 family peptidase [Candidatus Aminicenantes bacterium]